MLFRSAPPSNPSHADTMGERRGFTLFGLVSTYLDGNLAYHAVKSALACCDQVLVLEGPCGDPLQADVPATYLGELADDPRVTVQTGRWRTDAKKRTAMVEWAHRHASGPTWGLWLDADEYLVNGEFLPDWLQYLTWMDERDDTPTMRQPLRLVELDGSISMSYVKLVRVDLVREYRVSIANLVNQMGIEEKAGNLHEHIGPWMQAHQQAAKGFLYWPPGPGPLDPFIVHRSMLRHPDRAGLRLHEQEAQELRRIGTPPTV